MKELGVSIGSFVELKFYDFTNKLDSTNWDDDPEKVANTDLFYIDDIRWPRVNKTLLDSTLSEPLLKYFANAGIIRTNYANLIVVNASYPEGTALTVTVDKLYKAKAQKTLQKNSLIGEFVVHDSGDWQKTISTIPKGFLEGKFYYATGEIAD